MMLALKEIEKEVLSLPKEDYVTFRQWFFSQDQKNWDDEIKADSEAGKLDFLLEEACSEKKHGLLKTL
jgi:hypothetical protein